MKKLILALLLPLVGCAVGPQKVAQETPQTFHYEVTFSDDSEVKHLYIKHGEKKAERIEGERNGSIKELSYMPKPLWDSLTKDNNLPPHDFAKCITDICAYGLNERIKEIKSVGIQAIKDDRGTGVLMHIDYSEFNFATIKTSGGASIEIPVVNQFDMRMNNKMEVGEVLCLATPNGQVLATIKLVNIH